MSAREALRELTRLGLTARMQGAGVVVQQHPPAGAPLEPGATCTPGPQPSSLPTTQRSHCRTGGPRRPDFARWGKAVILGDVVDTLRDLTVHAPSAGRPVVFRSRPSHTTRDASFPDRLFVALKGLKADGLAFVDQAVSRGAKAIVV